MCDCPVYPCCLGGLDRGVRGGRPFLTVYDDLSESKASVLYCTLLTDEHFSFSQIGEDFVFSDAVMEEKYGFNLEESCKIAKENQSHGIGLFNGDVFYFITQTCPPSKIKDFFQDGFMTKQYVTGNLVPMINVCGGKVSDFSPFICFLWHSLWLIQMI